MLRWILPALVALVTMGIVMAVVLTLRPELRTGLGKLRVEGPIEIETPTD